VRTTEPIDGIHHYFSQPRAREPDVRLEQPPRVRRNFLTWAFFLAQVSAAELLLTGAAKAQDDELSENATNRPEAPSGPLPDDALQRTIDVAEAQTIAPPSSSIVGSQATPQLDAQAQNHLLPLGSLADQHTLPVGGTAGGGSSARMGSSGSAESSLPTMLPEIGGSAQEGPPEIDVHIGLSPLLGFDLQVDTGGLISGIGLDLGNLLVGPLETVTNLVDSLVGDLVSDLGNLLNNDVLGLGELLESGPLNLSELTGLTLTTGIAGLLQGGEAGSDAGNGAAANTPLISLSTPDGELSAPGLLSTGMINFAAITATVQLDELFAGGQHTDYNIALRNGPETGAEDASPSQPEIAGILPEALANEAPPPADSTAALLSPLDEFMTRPSV
jgi:hypothetical protein